MGKFQAAIRSFNPLDLTGAGLNSYTSLFPSTFELPQAAHPSQPPGQLG